MPMFLLPYLYSQIVLASIESMWTPPRDADTDEQ